MNKKKKVYEWAQELNVSSKEILTGLKKIGIEIKSHLSLLAEEKVELFLESLTKTKKKVKKEKEKKEKRKIPRSSKKSSTGKEKGVPGSKVRPPIVTIMGHVDHGKTTLLDAIRESNLVGKEAGDITQHIGAYQVSLKEGNITFLDTPGHEAFTALRARGAQVTDIVILIIAAEEGIMPQTKEAINHAKAAGVPLIVAINKIDKKEANPDKIKQQLADCDLTCEEWGGDTICVEISAIGKKGITNLLEMILLQTEMLELKANPQRKAEGIIIETGIDKGRGPVATVLIQNGTLHLGDAFITGLYAGKVKAMFNDKGERVKEAGPSTPIEVSGMSGVPQAGDRFQVVDNERIARALEIEKQEVARKQGLEETHHITLDELYNQIQKGELKELRIIIKADVRGSVEALKHTLEKLSNEKVSLRIIHGGVGEITENDIMLASASNAIVIGFHVKLDSNAQKIARYEEVDVRTYKVIYEAIADMQSALEGMLEPVYKEIFLGKAEVRQVFKVSKIGRIAGAYVVKGKITRNIKVKVMRNDEIVHQGKLSSLKHLKEDVKEVLNGFECGIGIEDFMDFQEGDIIEAYKVEK